MMEHKYLKYPPTCDICKKQPMPKVGVWHDNHRQIYLCNECYDKEAANESDNANLVEA